MTNVKLSKEELALVSEAGFILTKNRIINKVYDLFGQLSEDFQQRSKHLPGSIISIPPKISRGENYNGLPWVMLDYPRAFSNSDVFATRCFFWWGNFFSITLQLQGSYKDMYSTSIKRYLEENYGNWWICIADNPWQHHFDANNYIRYSAEFDLMKFPFIKLAKKIPLQEWDNSFDFFSITYQEILEILGTKPVK
jgi:hypothetical protein